MIYKVDIEPIQIQLAASTLAAVSEIISRFGFSRGFHWFYDTLLVLISGPNAIDMAIVLLSLIPRSIP